MPLDDCDFLSEKEKEAVYDVFENIDSSGHSMNIRPASVWIEYLEIYRGQNGVILYMDNATNVRPEIDDDYYYEQINEDWYVTIVYAPKG